MNTSFCSLFPVSTVPSTYGANKNILFDNQELLKLVIISFILIAFTFDLRVIQ